MSVVLGRDGWQRHWNESLVKRMSRLFCEFRLDARLFSFFFVPESLPR
jgi:hypothetical protein